MRSKFRRSDSNRSLPADLAVNCISFICAVIKLKFHEIYELLTCHNLFLTGASAFTCPYRPETDVAQYRVTAGISQIANKSMLPKVG